MESLRGFLDTLIQLRHQGPQPKFCPSCISANIYPKESYGMLPQIYSCKDCDYEGHVVLERDPEDRE